MMTVYQVCSELKASRAFVYRLMSTGELGFVEMGRARRIPRQAMLEYLAANYRPGNRA